MSRKNLSFLFAIQVLIIFFSFLFSINSSWAANLNVKVQTGEGRLFSGLNVYAFTEADSYTGSSAVTNTNGIATFNSDDFTAGNYKFRADYLGNQFWSQVITVPDVLSVSVVIEEATADIIATTSAGPVQGVNVYLFNGAGSYLGLNEVTDTDGKVAFELPAGKEFNFRADIMGGQYWSDSVTIQAGGINYIYIDAGGGIFQISAEKTAGVPMDGINTYLFSASGSYLSQTQATDSSGIVQYSVSAGDYKVRADYLGAQFWSADISVTEDTNTTITIPHQDVTITVNGILQDTNDPIENIPVYLFTAAGSYMSQNQVTASNSQVTFNLPEQPYKVRADYMGQRFWSDVFTWSDTAVGIPMADANIAVTGAGLPLEGVIVYVFTNSGSYLSVNRATDANGEVTFRIPAGSYDFRADYQGSKYWSDDVTLVADQVNTVSISTGGGIFELAVFKGTSDPLIGINCYVFSESGSYLGMSTTIDVNGLVSFPLADGTYKIRVDYLGVQFWTDVYEIPATLSNDFTIAHQDVTTTVNGTFQGSDDPIEGISIYLFTPSGSYMSRNQITDANGQVTFNLPEQPYKVRSDYMGQQFWSDEFTWTDTVVSIPMSDAEITVTGADQPLEGVGVYVFTGSGSYLSVNGTTDTSGEVSFRLPAGPYDFRADYQSSQYWGDDVTLLADQINPVSISTGGGTFELTVLKDIVEPLAGVNCYVFSESGSYLGMSATTDANGLVSFSLADGTYKFRVDYLGAQFWTDVYEVPTLLSDEFTVPHQDVTITVEESYQGNLNSIEGINIYLFSSSGSYMSQNQVTDVNGQVSFNLPDESYKVRADYLGQQFWSSDFTWTDTTVTIGHGLAQVHVTRSGADLEGAMVYLYADTGSYLNRNQMTDTLGVVDFLIPPGSYIFRADEGGDQRWSNVTAITADLVTNVEIEMVELLTTITLTVDPDEILTGGSTTLSWSSTNADSVTIVPDPGTVGLSGTTTVSPTDTTTYTATATGPNGTAQASAVVSVISAPLDLDLGLNMDEQQGGGGLVGETVRVLNGNMVDFRSDVQFSSPNRLGLSLGAVYNSMSVVTGAMGYGWSHTYEASLDPSFAIGGSIYLKIADSTGRAAYFTEEVPGEYTGVFSERSSVKLESGEYVWYRLDGSKYGFSSAGQLQWMDDATGNSLDLSYDTSNRLETVTDNASGRSLTFNYNTDDLLDNVVGPITNAVTDGIWVSYGYDTDQNLISVTYADVSGLDYTYTDPEDIHNLTEKRNRANHLINTWGYDTQDRAVSNFSRDGRGVDIFYTSETQVDVTDAYGKVRQYLLEDVNGRNRIGTITDGPGGAGAFPYSDSNAVAWIYDTEMRVEEVEYAGGSMTQYQNYDERSNPGTIILAIGSSYERTINYTFHPDMNAPLTRTEMSVLGTRDKETIWDYDDDGNSVPNENPTSLVYRTIEKGFTKDAAGTVIAYEFITSFTYNSEGQVLSIDGPLPGAGDTTTFAYDPVTGNLLSIARPLIGNTGFSGYDNAGQVETVTDVNSQSTSYAYDGRGRVTVTTNNADSSTSSTGFNLAGLPDASMDEDGVESRFEYDTSYGRLYKRYDYEDNYIAYTYDAKGNVIEKGYFDPADTQTNKKQYLYQDVSHDMPGLLFREINPDDTYTEYGYDLEGNVESMADPNGDTTFYAYDSLNRIITVTQPGSAITSYTYDDHGNLETVTDAIGNMTTYEYDDMGRVVSTTSPDTGTVHYAYDEAGNPVDKTDAKGINVTYIYDDLNRLTNVNFPDSTQDISYTYDAGTNGIGRRTGMSDESGNMTFGYDARGRLVDKTNVVNSITYSILRDYTPGGRVESIIYPSGRTVDFDRTSCACKVDGIDTTYNSTTTTIMANLTYRPFGGATGMSTGGGGTVGSLFDANGRMVVSNPGATHEKTYTYDNNGNLTSITAPSTPWVSRTYSYDELNRLTHADGYWGSTDYTYDDVGNRQTKIESGVTETYTYVSGTNSLDIADTTVYTYDLNGNITGIDAKVLTYNQNNRLVMVEEDGSTLGEYTYNGLGQRILKIASGVTTTVFHYDFNGNIIGESDIDGTFAKEYIYKGSSRLAMVDVGTEEIFFFGNDALGTPQILTDSTNTAVWEGKYKPFGETEVNPNSSVVNNFRFPGQYYDSGTGLHYNYHRYYDPKTGRYLRPDPIGLEGGINLYPYGQNNPINLSDPIGLIWVTIGHDKDGFKNWFIVIVRHISSIEKGKPMGSQPKHYEQGTQDVIQEWQHDPENPCQDNYHTIGAIRRIRQTYIKMPTPKRDELWNYDKSHYWSPPVPSRTYREYINVRIEGDLGFYGTGTGWIP